LVVNIQRWIARRETDWQQFDTLLNRVERQGLKTLRATEIKQLSSLYRSVSADLARARTHHVGDALIQSLQRLTARGYSQIYQGSRRQEWQAVWDFYRWGLPATLRHNGVYIAIATAIFALGSLVSWWFAWRDPAFMALVVPQRLISLVQKGELWMGSIVGIEPLASSNIMINNLSVSFAAVAGGMLFGLGTTWILFLNGVNLGAIATLVGQNQLAYPFWAFVFPHGSLELPAIFLAGGAGLLLARAILLPGRYQRREALRYYGLQATRLMYGVIPMLVIAGVIEGFFSPSPLVPSFLKYLVGISLFTALVWYGGWRHP
jgi:uncharacterized membrane protein SpoIIM required for sporulation